MQVPKDGVGGQSDGGEDDEHPGRLRQRPVHENRSDEKFRQLQVPRGKSRQRLRECQGVSPSLIYALSISPLQLLFLPPGPHIRLLLGRADRSRRKMRRSLMPRKRRPGERFNAQGCARRETHIYARRAYN